MQAKAHAVAFIGDRLDDVTLAQPVLKRAVAGALYRDNYSKLRSETTDVVWEIQKCLNPPACLKAFKPKVYMLGTLRMEAGMLYELKL